MAHNILAPDALGPTVCIGEILVEIMAKTPGNTFLEAQTWIGPFPAEPQPFLSINVAKSAAMPP